MCKSAPTRAGYVKRLGVQRSEVPVNRKETVRICFRTAEVLRRFFWVAMGSDGSVYFGNASANAFRRGYTATTDVPVGGAHNQPETSGTPHVGCRDSR